MTVSSRLTTGVWLSSRVLYLSFMTAETARTRVNLLGKSAEELRAWMESLGEPAYRGSQLYRALYTEKRFDLAALSNLPASLRQSL